MASIPSPLATPRKASSALDPALAALAALSVAFATFAMPDYLFSRLIVASHLPLLLPMAEPPLGMTARLAVIAVGATLVFAGTWFLLRTLDKLPRRKAPREVEAESVPEAPRLRRRDFHPDAPSRRPISAGREIGEPVEAFEVETVTEAPVEVPEVLQEPEPEPKPEPEPQAESADLDVLELAEHFTEIEEGAPAPAAPHADESIGRLMERLEGGLSRRVNQGAAGAPKAEEVDDHLRSAVSALQKMTGRAG